MINTNERKDSYSYRKVDYDTIEKETKDTSNHAISLEEIEEVFNKVLANKIYR